MNKASTLLTPCTCYVKETSTLLNNAPFVNKCMQQMPLAFKLYKQMIITFIFLGIIYTCKLRVYFCVSLLRDPSGWTYHRCEATCNTKHNMLPFSYHISLTS